ncbi:D-Ala-D-Ala carboxypeptidase family metallohydrolase [Ideonella sp.]|uniref:D-Ala-D-Ala carboxypeptidase family metallohydrolase n=1 Tax=Ideonella sp. TaxID=1929293 RepID=UPI0035B4C66C
MKRFCRGALGTTVALACAASAHAACGDSRDALIQEYVTYGVSLRPTCSNFTSSRRTEYFAFSELETGDYSWALLRSPFVAAKSTGYGIDRWRYEYGGPRYTNSVYRNPARNRRIGGATQSRHMYGDAADLDNRSGSTSEWWNMYYAAGRAHADWREPTNGPCGYACHHADWRSHSGGYSSTRPTEKAADSQGVAEALAVFDASGFDSPDWQARAAMLGRLLDAVGGTETLGFRAGRVGDLLASVESAAADGVKARLVSMLALENREVLIEKAPVSEDRSEYHAALTGVVANLRDARALPALGAALPTGFIAQRGVALLGVAAVPTLSQAFDSGLEPAQAGALHSLELLLAEQHEPMPAADRRAVRRIVLGGLAHPDFNIRLAAVGAAAHLAATDASVRDALVQLRDTDPYQNLDPEGISPAYPVRAAVAQRL